jgi:predicted RNA polymerase sigma factor
VRGEIIDVRSRNVMNSPSLAFFLLEIFPLRYMISAWHARRRSRTPSTRSLNLAAGLAIRDGPLAGLAVIGAILVCAELTDYHHAHSAKVDLCRHLGRTEDARASYERALGLAQQEPQRRFLERRLAELKKPSERCRIGDPPID